MLVLSRTLGEKVVIGDQVVVNVVGIQGGKVRLGIDAPPCVPVVRSELLRDWQESVCDDGVYLVSTDGRRSIGPFASIDVARQVKSATVHAAA